MKVKGHLTEFPVSIVKYGVPRITPSQHEAVSEATAIGIIPDEKWGERTLVLVVLKQYYKGKVTEDEIKILLKKFVDRGRLPRYGLPDRIEFVKAIPKTSVGKINKFFLREMYTK